jgi:hypothetical protein
MAGNEIVAARVDREIVLNAADPAPDWQRAVPVCFHTDWRGCRPEPKRETSVCVLWSPQMLYLRFECHYHELFVFPDSDASGRRNHLWDRDVAEVFIQPDPSQERHYKEFEIAPNGMWVDLDIFPGGMSDLNSGMTRSVVLNEASRRWTAELAIPMSCLTKNFDPNAIWRINFFRIEGPKEPRHYMAWQPTHAPTPNFHVPNAFGLLRFSR